MNDNYKKFLKARLENDIYELISIYEKEHKVLGETIEVRLIKINRDDRSLPPGDLISVEISC